MEQIGAEFFQFAGGSSGGAVVPSWAAPFVYELTATDVSNGYVDLPDLAPIANSVLVSLSGLFLSPGCDYSLTGNRVTFLPGSKPRAGMNFQARYQIN